MVEFINQWALYFLALLVPIIILYLLRPKPKDLRIPSLMFIMDMEQRKRFRSFLKKIVRDPLLILQLLAISLLVAAMANPFYVAEETKRVREDVAIVLDVSASMQAGERFEQARQTALSIVEGLGAGDKVSIVLAGNIPVVILRRGGKSRARDLLGGIGPGASPSGLGGAILLASDLVEDSEVDKRIYVISDFSHYRGVDPLAAQKQAFAKGIGTEFIRVEGGSSNIAIVDARSGRNLNGCHVEVLVKNYDAAERNVQLQLSLDGRNAGSRSVDIRPMSSGAFKLSADCSAAEHRAVVSIAPGGDLAVDDKVYAVIGEAVDINVLLLREKGSDKHVRYALEAMEGVAIDEMYPPIYPQEYGSYDTVIFQGAAAQNVLAGTFAELREFVEGGGHLVAMGFEDLASVPSELLADLLPVDPLRVVHSSGNPQVIFDHPILREVDAEGIQMRRYIEAEDKVGSITLVRFGGSPILSLWDVGAGKVAYLGISSNSSDFHLKPSFPIFWHGMLQWINRDESVSNVVNFRAGEQLPVLIQEAVRVRKPSGEVVEGTDVLLDQAGFYEMEGTSRVFSASLLDEDESDITYRIEAASKEILDRYRETTITEEVPRELFWTLALAGLALIMVEWLYYKRRGSL